jgi:MFS family permease
MVESATTPRRGLAGGWLVVAAGSCIGLSIMGDSLMYSVLPLAAPGLGIPLPLVGVLLSVNRLVRLLSNAWASRIFERMGPRVPFLGSLVIGAVATLLYGATGFAVFFAARLLWGIARADPVEVAGARAGLLGEHQHAAPQQRC